MKRLKVSALTVACLASLLVVEAPSGHASDSSTANVSRLLTRDSLQLRRELETHIARFQQQWRREWQRSMIDRGSGVMNLQQALVDDSSGFNNTPDLIRLRALACYVGFTGLATIFQERPTMREEMRRLAPQARRTATQRIRELEKYRLNTRAPTRISGRRSEASACPQWIPDGEGIPADEGEQLDFALTPKARTRVRAERGQLILRLESAAAAHPEDVWISGQRVRFLLDNAEFDRAVAAARSCRGARAMCASLEALALASGGRVAEAERAFSESLLSGMRPSTATCSDTTVRALYAEDVQLSLRGYTCEQLDEVATRSWWLADPLWSVPGNERLVEHYVRHTWLALRTILEEDERFIWRRTAAGDGLREVINRYGWPTHTFWGGTVVDNAISVVAADSFNMQSEHPYTVKEYAADRVSLVPAFRAIESPFDALDTDWQWSRPSGQHQDTWWPAEHMHLPYRLARLPEGQSVLLRRDWSIYFGVAIDDAVHGLDRSLTSAPRVVLAAGSGPQNTRILMDRPLEFGRSLHVSAAIPAEPMMLSIEVPNRSTNEPAHRLRFGMRPPPSLSQMALGDVAISDPAFVLLPAFGAPPILDPDSAIARLAGSVQLPRSVPLALYWESYGIAVGDTVDVQLRILRDDGSALRSIGAFFGLADAQRDSVSIRWREPDPGRNARELPTIVPAVARAISVDIRSLAPGTYVFSVEMRRTNGSTARGQRRVEILP